MQCDISTLSHLLSQNLEDIENWFRENKTYTYININKTDTLLVVKKRLRQRLENDKIDLPIQLNIKDIK